MGSLPAGSSARHRCGRHRLQPPDTSHMPPGSGVRGGRPGVAREAQPAPRGRAPARRRVPQLGLARDRGLLLQWHGDSTTRRRRVPERAALRAARGAGLRSQRLPVDLSLLERQALGRARPPAPAGAAAARAVHRRRGEHDADADVCTCARARRRRGVVARGPVDRGAAGRARVRTHIYPAARHGARRRGKQPAHARLATSSTRHLRQESNVAFPHRS